jgi:hypothetical protein
VSQLQISVEKDQSLEMMNKIDSSWSQFNQIQKETIGTKLRFHLYELTQHIFLFEKNIESSRLSFGKRFNC